MEGELRARCDACGHDLEQESPVIYDCFHALHVACAYGSEACCPLCRAPCTRTTTRPVAPGADSSVAGNLRSNGDGVPFADAGETSTRPALCDACGGEFDPREIPFVSPNCNHALHLGCSYSAGGACPCCPDTPPISPWCSSCYSMDDFGSPGLSQTPCHADMFDENPPATDSPYTPRQPSYTGPFAQQPPAPASTSEPPPAQLYGPPPSYYQPYSHAGVFGQPPPTAPHAFASPQPPQAEAGQQFGCPPSSQPSQDALFQQMPPPPAFENLNHYNFPPVGPPPAAPSHPFHASLQRPIPVYSSRSLQPPPSHALFPAGYLPVCAFCGGAMCRGQTTVASQCNHTFHFRCFAGMFCPVCGAQWSDVAVPVIPPPPPFKSWF